MFGKFTVTGKTPKLSSSFGEKLQEEVYTSDFVSLVSCCTSWLPIQTMTEEGNCHVVVQSDHFISHQKCVQMRELRRGVCTSCGLFDWTYSWSCLSACCWPMSSTCGALAFLLACANSPCSLHKHNLPVFLFKVEQRYWISKGSSNIFQIFCVQRALFISVPKVLHGFYMDTSIHEWSHFLAEVDDAEQLLQSNRTILGQKSNKRSNVAQTWRKRGTNVAAKSKSTETTQLFQHFSDFVCGEHCGTIEAANQHSHLDTFDIRLEDKLLRHKGLHRNHFRTLR